MTIEETTDTFTELTADLETSGPDWRRTAVDELAFVLSEVVPLVRRRVTGIRESDTMVAKWPVPVHPSDGLKRLAGSMSGAALRERSGFVQTQDLA